MAKALILATLIIVSGCQTQSGSFCLIEKPQFLTAAEIDVLPDSVAASILARNEKGRKFCGWGKAK